MTDYNAILDKMMRAGEIVKYDEFIRAHRRQYDQPQGVAFVADLNGELAFLEEWSTAHPVKTYAMDCKERIPTSDPGSLCIAHVYGACARPEYCQNLYHPVASADATWQGCTACWNRPMPELKEEH